MAIRPECQQSQDALDQKWAVFIATRSLYKQQKRMGRNSKYFLPCMAKQLTSYDRAERMLCD